MLEEPSTTQYSAQDLRPPPLPHLQEPEATSKPSFSLPRTIVLLGIVGCGVAGLHFFPPGQGGFYPPCLFHRATGLDCPGCGATRAAYSLLHGNIGVAWHQNALLVLLAPAGLIGGGVAAWRWTHRRPMPSLPGQPWTIYMLLAAMAIFGIARNMR
ncbi:MAG: DUF2752 domain-containing protein [Verrucomicrobiales bacterium]|nr:DUF2752 domain-containing protein [Verrucomicrobiales bacterium]